MKRISLLLFIIASGFQFSLIAQSATKTQKLNTFLDEFAKYNKLMASVGFMEKGEIVYQKATGFVSIANEQKANPETVYRIGSISKTFTATMIFQLIEEGKLSLDTKLSTFYPTIKNADNITISNLLNHRSGIFNFTDDKAYLSYMNEAKTEQEIVKIITDLGSNFEPNEKASYSNSGYYLLGRIIEKVTKSTYQKQLKKRITKKLNLKHTKYGGKIDIENNEANSYKWKGKAWQKESETDMSIPHGAGAIVSNTGDLMAFIDGLFNGKLLKAASLEKMIEIEEGYGRGIFVFPLNDMKGYGHNGGIDGFQSNLVYFKEQKTAFTLLTNGANYPLNDVMIGVLSIWFDLPYKMPNLNEKEIELSEADLKKYEGIYASKQIPLKITFKVQDGKLTAQATGQGAFPLTVVSKTKFKFEPAGIVLLFDEADSFKNFTLKQGGGSFDFTRE